MRKRTKKIQAIVDRANLLLALPTISMDGKEGICILLESILMDVRQYEGYKQINPPDKGWDKSREYERFYF